MTQKVPLYLSAVFWFFVFCFSIYFLEIRKIRTFKRIGIWNQSFVLK